MPPQPAEEGRPTGGPPPSEGRPERAKAEALVPGREQALRQTLALCGEEPMDGQQRRALRAIAARHRGAPFSVDPILIELVQAALRGLSPPDRGPEAMRRLAREVAETLYEDPTARRRLETFWTRLCET